jgi:hypothetical protein
MPHDFIGQEGDERQSECIPAAHGPDEVRLLRLAKCLLIDMADRGGIPSFPAEWSKQRAGQQAWSFSSSSEVQGFLYSNHIGLVKGFPMMIDNYDGK